jgi:signal transduction histidine kinase
VTETEELLNLDPRKESCQIVNESKEPYYATVDPEQIKQVLLNLGLNAFHAMNDNRENGILTFRVMQKDDRVIVQVEDNGPGIPQEALDKLFDPFFTTKVGGTGMGLAVVDRIVRAHGGSVSAKNLRQGGCRFDVEFNLSPF